MVAVVIENKPPPKKPINVNAHNVIKEKTVEIVLIHLKMNPQLQSPFQQTDHYARDIFLI